MAQKQERKENKDMKMAHFKGLEWEGGRGIKQFPMKKYLLKAPSFKEKSVRETNPTSLSQDFE